jgi:hypothetical protein
MYFAHVGITEWFDEICVRHMFLCDYIVVLKTLPRRFVQNAPFFLNSRTWLQTHLAGLTETK